MRVDEIISNLNNLELINKKNFLGLVDKLKDPYSSKRFGFRENMSFIIALSYFILNKNLKFWSK